MTHPAISALDRQLARKGETVVLRRFADNGAPTDVAAFAVCRGGDPVEVAGGVTAARATLVLSPTDLDAAGWPAPPRIADQVTYQGRARTVTAVAPVKIGDTIVRYDLTVCG